jgi:tripartite-type tricarboxylate transporter receptor subunit TctC
MVGFPPGGSVDIVARVLGQKLAEQMGQSFVVDNKPGAIGTLAMNAMGSVPADGYTILLGTNPQVRPGMTDKDDPYRKFEPIALTSVIPMALLANPGFAAGDAQAFAELARKPGDPVPFATPGRGSPMELAMASLKARAGLNLLHVPYNGGPPAVNDTMAGQVPLVAVGLPTALGQVKAGKLKPLAVLQGSRTELLPGVPTIGESLGIADSGFVVWLGFFAPVNTPAPVIQRLEAELGKALADPQVRSKLEGAALEVRFAPAGDLEKLVREQYVLTVETMQKYGNDNK